MAVIQCPHCGTQLDAPPSTLAGGNARCRSCGGRFVIPGLIAAPPASVFQPEPPPAPQQPPLVVIHSSEIATRRELRLESTGWFARSFMTTMGVVVGLLFIPLAIAAAIVVLVAVVGLLN